MTARGIMPPERGFLGLSTEDVERVKDRAPQAVVIPFGLEASVSYGGGTRRGPSAIIAASHQVELFDEELWREPFCDYSLQTMEEFVIEQPLDRALDQIASIINRELVQGRFPMVLGGEHSLTAGAIRPFAEKFEDLVVLQFDAHADLRDGYEGEKYSHAAAMRRVLDFENIDLVSVGLRNISAEEIPFFESAGKRIHTFWAKDRHRWNVDDIVRELRGRPVYVTFDLDVFDSSLMPATGTPEPGGIFFDEALKILRAASAAGRIVGSDIVELAPIHGLHACDFLAAKLAYKILSYSLSRLE